MPVALFDYPMITLLNVALHLDDKEVKAMIHKAKLKASREQRSVKCDDLLALSKLVALKHGAPDGYALNPAPSVRSLISFVTTSTFRQQAWIQSMRTTVWPSAGYAEKATQVAVASVECGIPAQLAAELLLLALAKQEISKAASIAEKFKNERAAAEQSVRSMVDDLRGYMAPQRRAAILAHYMV